MSERSVYISDDHILFETSRRRQKARTIIDGLSTMAISAASVLLMIDGANNSRSWEIIVGAIILTLFIILRIAIILSGRDWSA